MPDTKKSGSSFRRELALMAAATMLGFGGIALFAWHEFGDADLGFNGYLALILGAFFTAVVGVGLMALVFFSSRSGHDEEVYSERRYPRK